MLSWSRVDNATAEPGGWAGRTSRAAQFPTLCNVLTDRDHKRDARTSMTEHLDPK
jgi:hypothetical protein